MKKNWRKSGKLPLKDIKLVMKRKQEEDGELNYGFVKTLMKNNLPLEPEYSYSTEKQNLELIKDALSNVNTYENATA
jgi:hypothetical protein